MLTLASGTLTNNSFTFIIAGTPGAFYAVQAATNLDAPVWLPVCISTTPFVFTTTNTIALPQQFFRAATAP